MALGFNPHYLEVSTCSPCYHVTNSLDEHYVDIIALWELGEKVHKSCQTETNASETADTACSRAEPRAAAAWRTRSRQ